jgi:hypothetical protein
VTKPTDEPEPFYLRTIPCKHLDEENYVRDDGTCMGCGEKVPYDRLGPKRPYALTRRAKPHDRAVLGIIVEDPASCSCGGWYGTPIGLDRVANGAEVLLLSFQQKIDDMEHNIENLVNLVLTLNERLADEGE